MSGTASSGSRRPPRYELAPPARLLAALAALLVLVTFACRSAPPAQRGRAGYVERGIASWYGPGFHGRKTASGERYDMHDLTAAHRTLPFDSLVEVRNRDNGKRVVVRINDRGPFIRGRIIDLSLAGARAIDMVGPGTARVEIQVVDAKRRARRKAPAAAGYLVQAAAFRERKKARRLAARLQKTYPGVRVSSGEGWHRVILGPYPSRAEADQIVRELELHSVAALVRIDD